MSKERNRPLSMGRNRNHRPIERTTRKNECFCGRRDVHEHEVIWPTMKIAGTDKVMPHPGPDLNRKARRRVGETVNRWEKKARRRMMRRGK